MTPDPPADPVPTVRMSLDALADALLKAVDDLTAVHGAIELTRDSPAETSALAADADRSRALVVAATRAVDELRRVDESLTVVLKTLEGR